MSKCSELNNLKQSKGIFKMYHITYEQGLFFAEECDTGVCGKGTSPRQALQECKAACASKQSNKPTKETLLREYMQASQPTMAHA